MRRVENASQKQDYDAANRAGKDKFRKEWAEKTYSDYEEARKHIVAEQHKERSIGRYMNMDQLVREEGGKESPSAVEGAIRYAIACIRMRGKWVKVHKLTKRTLFLYVHEEHIDSFEESWIKYQVERNKSCKPSQSMEGGEERPPAPKKRGGKPAGLGDGTCKAGKPQTEQRKRAREQESTVFKTMSKYRQQMSAAKAMQKRVAEEQPWSWARSDENIGRLATKVTEIDTLITGSHFLIELASNSGETVAMQDLKKTYKDAGKNWEEHIGDVPTQDIDKMLSDLSDVSSALCRMHAAKVTGFKKKARV